MSRQRTIFITTNIAAILGAIAFAMAAPMSGGSMISGDDGGTTQTPPPPPPATDGHIWIP
jgi:hypothetical protein